MKSNDQCIYVLRPTRIGMLVDGGTEEEQVTSRTILATSKD